MPACSATDRYHHKNSSKVDVSTRDMTRNDKMQHVCTTAFLYIHAALKNAVYHYLLLACHSTNVQQTAHLATCFPNFPFEGQPSHHLSSTLPTFPPPLNQR